MVNLIILDSIKAVLEPVLRENQAGFQTNRSCTDQIFSLRSLLQKLQDKGLNGVSCLVDFHAAFDSLDRESL